MQGVHSGSDFEPDQELTSPGASVFTELSPEIPEPVPVKLGSSSKLSKGRDASRTSELYIGGLEDMKVSISISCKL